MSNARCISLNFALFYLVEAIGSGFLDMVPAQQGRIPTVPGRVQAVPGRVLAVLGMIQESEQPGKILVDPTSLLDQPVDYQVGYTRPAIICYSNNTYNYKLTYAYRTHTH